MRRARYRDDLLADVSELGELERRALEVAGANGHSLAISEDTVDICGVTFRWTVNTVAVKGNTLPCDEACWHLLKMRVLAHYIQSGGPLTDEEVREILLAATGVEPP